MINLALDVTQERSVQSLIQTTKPRVVFHLAAIVDTRCGWPHQQRLRRVNVDATRFVAKAAKSAKSRLVSLSSSSVSVSDSAYGKTKQEAEDIILENSGICLRPWKVYGAGDQLGTDHFLSGKFPTVILPENKVGLCYIRNLAELIVFAGKNGIPGTLYDVGDDLVTYRHFADSLLALKSPYGTNPTTAVEIPYSVAKILAKLIPWIDTFVSVCLGGRPAPLNAALMLNPVVLELMEIPKKGWSWTEAQKAPELLGMKRHTFRNFSECLEDIARLHGASWEERLPLAYGVGKEPLTVLQGMSLTKHLRLSNHIVKAATFEGLADENGIPKSELIEFHENVAKSGVGMTTVAYGAVSAGGRSFPNQVIVSKNSLPALRNLVQKVQTIFRTTKKNMTTLRQLQLPKLQQV